MEPLRRRALSFFFGHELAQVFEQVREWRVSGCPLVESCTFSAWTTSSPSSVGCCARPGDLLPCLRPLGITSLRG